MARQATTPIQFNKSMRRDDGTLMSSGRAGKVQCVGFVPLLRGDSMTGAMDISIELGEMPRPLINGVTALIQAYVVPKQCDPRFNGTDELMASYIGKPIKTLGQADRQPPAWFNYFTAPSARNQIQTSEFFRDMGLHVVTGKGIQLELVDAFNIVYNNRLAALSNKLTLRAFASTSLTEALAWPRAIWPQGPLAQVVADYEAALIEGDIQLRTNGQNLALRGAYKFSGPSSGTGLLAVNPADPTITDTNGRVLVMDNTDPFPALFSEIEQINPRITTQSIDKARMTQAFARMVSNMAGNETTGYDNADVIMANLMQGFSVPDDAYKKPWLLGQARVPFDFGERFATDGPSLTQSVVQGRAMASIRLNVPALDYGGMVIFTLEVLPDRIFEAQSDPWLHKSRVTDLPDALRDSQNPMPVAPVVQSRFDARHAAPDGLYGYEPLNAEWNREATRLGGAFFQPTAGAVTTAQRSGVWQTQIVNPTFTSDHYLAPLNFPHDVFSDTLAPAYEFVCRHSATIAGITQFGDVLQEDNQDHFRVLFNSGDSVIR